MTTHADDSSRELLEKGKAARKSRKLISAKELLREAFKQAALQEDAETEAEAGYFLALVHDSLGNDSAAVETQAKSVAIYRELTMEKDVAHGLRHLGSLYLQLGKPEEALEVLQEAAQSFGRIQEEQGGQTRNLAQTQNRLATAYYRLNRFQEAYVLFEEARKSLQDAGLGRSEATVLVDGIPTLLALNFAEEARKNALRAIRLYGDVGNPSLVAIAKKRLAEAQLRLGQRDLAMLSLESALTLHGDSKDRRRRIQFLIALGNTLAYTEETPWSAPPLPPEDAERAREVWDEALFLAEQIQDQELLAFSLLGFARLELREGDLSSAQEAAGRGIEIFQKAGNKTRVATGRRIRSEILWKMGDLHSADEEIQAAIQQIEENRNSVLYEEIRLSYLDQRQDYFEIARGILYDLHVVEPRAGHEERAFELNENRLARSLLDTIPGPRSIASEREEASPEEQKALEALRAGFADSTTPDVFLRQLRRNLDLARSARRASRNTERSLVTIPEVLSDLDEETLVLVYSLGENRSFLWALDHKTIRFHDLPERNEIEGQARILYRQFEDRRNSQSADRLGKELLEPVADLLEKPRRVVILREGDLQLVPFAALPTPSSSSGERAEYMIENHEVIYAPSLSVVKALRDLRRSRSAAEKWVVSFADPDFSVTEKREDGLDPMMTRSMDSLGLEGLSRLPGSLTESNGIRDLIPSDKIRLFLHQEANQRNFMDYAKLRSRVLHVATHALVDDLYPEFSGIVLSQSNEEKTQGFLQAFEVAGLDIPADLVVLSACETGKGKDISGEGLMGLSRSFFQAGATGVIASLWEIDDSATSRLILDTLRYHLSEGMTPSAALRFAQIQMLKEPKTSSPYFWAGLFYQGDWQVTESETSLRCAEEGDVDDGDCEHER